MRTTLDIDDDLIQAARQLAGQRKATIGQVVSELMRRGMESKTRTKMRNGVPLLVPKPGGRKPSLPFINALRDEE